MPTLITTTAFPYTNPYTQKRGSSQCSSSSSHQSSQLQFEQNLRELVRSNHVPSTQTVEQVWDLLHRSNQEDVWSFSLAEGLVTFVIRIFGCHDTIDTKGRNADGYPATLALLARALDQWSHDESIMYAAVTQEIQVDMDHKTLCMSLLQTLHNLVAHFQDPTGRIANSALMGLSIIWRYLDRIHRLTCWKSTSSDFPSHAIDSAWWMPPQDEQALVRVALTALLSKEKTSDDSTTHIYPSEEELTTARLSLLTHLLKHDRTSWIEELASQNRDALSHLSRSLLEAMSRLNNNDLTSRRSLHCTIASVTLLCLMDHKVTLELSNQFNQLFYTTKLLDCVFQTSFGMFGAGSPSGPRWTYEHKDASTIRWMEEFIVVWSQCKVAGTRQLAFDALERHWRTHIEKGWHSFLTEDFSNHDDVARKHNNCGALLSRLVLLYSVHHISLRTSLFNSMAQLSTADKTTFNSLVQPCRNLLKTLQSLSFHPDTSIALCAASFTKALLYERGSLLPHQDVYEKAIDRDLVHSFLMGVATLMKPQGTSTQVPICRPLLLCLLDILDLVLSFDQVLLEAVQMVGSELVEVFVSVMTPKEIRIDQAGAFMQTSHNTTIMEESDSDTPPANNLSRLDERSMCVEKEEEEKATTCLDHYIRIATATILSRFGYFNIDNHLQQEGGTTISSENERSLRLLQNRVRQAIPDFFSAINKQQGDDCLISTGFANVTSASMESTWRHVRLLVAMSVPENEEFLASQLLAKDKDRENAIVQLEGKIQDCQSQLQVAAQTEARLTKGMDDIKKRMDEQSVQFWREAQRMKHAHTEEKRSKISQYDAERKAAERRVVSMSRELQEARDRAREADQAAKVSHEAGTQVRLELQNASEEVNALGKENEKLKHQVEEKDATTRQMKATIANLKGEQTRLQELLESRDSTIAGLKEARDGMEINLDNLFSDLVKLCQMYEVVEKQAENRRVSRDEFSRQLEEERKQKSAAEQCLRSQNEQLQAENDKLQKKLTRYREKVEAVKQERQGTVLDSNSHRSSARSTSNKHGVSSKAHKPSSHDARGKENYAYESKQRGRSNTEVEKNAAIRRKESQYAYESQLRPRDENMDTYSRRKDVGLPSESQRRSRTESQYKHRPYH